MKPNKWPMTYASSNSNLVRNGARRPLLLATRYTMEHGFYAERMRRQGVEVMVPDAEGRTTTHDIIFDELCAGHVKNCSREKLMAIIEKARADGADSVILGCTEIGLLVGAQDARQENEARYRPLAAWATARNSARPLFIVSSHSFCGSES